MDLPDGQLEIIELPEEGDTVGAAPFTPPIPRLGGLRLQWAAMAHKPESRGFRFTDPTGFSVVYSGDTDHTPALVALSRHADLLICESAMPDGRHVPGHLTPGMISSFRLFANKGDRPRR